MSIETKTTDLDKPIQTVEGRDARVKRKHFSSFNPDTVPWYKSLVLRPSVEKSCDNCGCEEDCFTGSTFEREPDAVLKAIEDAGFVVVPKVASDASLKAGELTFMLTQSMRPIDVAANVFEAMTEAAQKEMEDD